MPSLVLPFSPFSLSLSLSLIIPLFAAYQKYNALELTLSVRSIGNDAVNGNSDLIVGWTTHACLKTLRLGRLLSELKYVAVPQEDQDSVVHGLGSECVCVPTEAHALSVPEILSDPLGPSTSLSASNPRSRPLYHCCRQLDGSPVTAT